LRSKADHILNLTETILPLALLKVTEAFRKTKKGEILEILTEDKETRDDLFKVLPSSLYHLIAINKEESLWSILLRKN
jgi:TusA-related sulfurtransferase